MRRGGFTLVETLIAMVLATILMGLVSHAFLVQNEYYATQIARAGVQDNVRAATALVAREVRTSVEDGIVTAGARTLTVRSPIVVGLVCNSLGSSGAVQTEGGEAALPTGEVRGMALRNDSTWEYVNNTWASLNGADGSSAADCASNGADTLGAIQDFHQLNAMDGFASSVNLGSVVMLYREITYTIETSVLDPSTLGLFRTVWGAPAIEFATGIDTTSQFQYRTAGTSTYADTVNAASVGLIDAVRFVAEGRRPPVTGGRDAISFGWSVNLPIRSLR